MWKENLGNYLIDVSKYFLTGVFVTSLIKDMEEVRWLIYVLSGTIAGILLVVGLYLEAVWNLFQLFIKNVFEDFYLFL